MNYSYIFNVLSLSHSPSTGTLSLCFLTNPISSSRTCLSDFSSLYFSTFHVSSSPWYSVNLIDCFTFWFWFNHLSCIFIFPFPTFFPPYFILINYSVSSTFSISYSQESWRQTLRSWSSSPWCSSSPATLPVSTVFSTYCISLSPSSMNKPILNF